MSFFQYLCIVLPATEIGEYLENWSNIEQTKKFSQAGWRLWRLVAIATIMLSLIIAILTGF